MIGLVIPGSYLGAIGGHGTYTQQFWLLAAGDLGCWWAPCAQTPSPPSRVLQSITLTWRTLAMGGACNPALSQRNHQCCVEKSQYVPVVSDITFAASEALYGSYLLDNPPEIATLACTAVFST